MSRNVCSAHACRNGKSAAKAAAEVPTDAFDELFYVAGGAAAWEVSRILRSVCNAGYRVKTSRVQVSHQEV